MAQTKHGDTTSELAADIVESAQQLVRLEISLAKQEVKELAVQNGIAIGLLAGAGFFAALTLLVALPVLIIVLVPAHWIAALIWVALYFVLALGMGLVGRSRLAIRPPQRTLASLKETKAWVLHQLSTNGK